MDEELLAICDLADDELRRIGAAHNNATYVKDLVKETLNEINQNILLAVLDVTPTCR